MSESAKSVTAQPGQDALAQLRHDLSTPIHQILGYSELLEEEAGADPSTLVADLHKIQQAANTMLALVRGRITGDLLLQPAVTAGVDPQADRGADGDADAQVPDAAVRSSRTSSPGRILAVDDDGLNLDVLAQRLTRQGHLVSTAVDGQQALERLRQQSFDLVLLDVMMPRLDGYATLAALKADERWRPIPVIMISALDELSAVVRCIEAGAEDYLSKPFNSILLQARVGACLEKKFAADRQIALYQQLLLSQQQLDRELADAHRRVAALDPSVRQIPGVAPLLDAFARMSGAVSRRETDLRSTLSDLTIEINRSQLGSQLNAIVADPGFASLSARAKAMRQRRRAHGANP